MKTLHNRITETDFCTTNLDECGLFAIISAMIFQGAVVDCMVRLFEYVSKVRDDSTR